jgi:fatty acid desaturase
MIRKESNEKRNKGRIPKGYRFQAFEKPLLRRLCKTSLPASCAVAASDWAWIFACMYLGTTFTAAFGWAWAVPLHLLLLWPICSRSLRGFENLTHEASHHNFCRRRKELNDTAGNWLCAYWVLISVDMFRGPHRNHHHHFGGDDDPDKKRFARLDLDNMPRRSPLSLALYLLRVMPTYVLDYWRQFSDKGGQLIMSLLAHVLLVLVVSIAVNDKFWLLWLIYFWVPFIFYLPVHRFLAEAEEHRYQGAESEFVSTFSNIGPFHRWFLHPHGDGYHLLHHMLAEVPHWKMWYAHWVLSALDATFDGGAYRRSVFDEPKKREQRDSRHSSNRRRER